MTVDFSIETMKASGQWNGSLQGLEENKTANLEFDSWQKYLLKIKASKYIFRETKTREFVTKRSTLNDAHRELVWS